MNMKFLLLTLFISVSPLYSMRPLEKSDILHAYYDSYYDNFSHTNPFHEKIVKEAHTLELDESFIKEWAALLQERRLGRCEGDFEKYYKEYSYIVPFVVLQTPFKKSTPRAMAMPSLRDRCLKCVLNNPNLFTDQQNVLSTKTGALQPCIMGKSFIAKLVYHQTYVDTELYLKYLCQFPENIELVVQHDPNGIEELITQEWKLIAEKMPLACIKQLVKSLVHNKVLTRDELYAIYRTVLCEETDECSQYNPKLPDNAFIKALASLSLHCVALKRQNLEDCIQELEKNHIGFSRLDFNNCESIRTIYQLIAAQELNNPGINRLFYLNSSDSAMKVLCSPQLRKEYCNYYVSQYCFEGFSLEPLSIRVIEGSLGYLAENYPLAFKVLKLGIGKLLPRNFGM